MGLDLYTEYSSAKAVFDLADKVLRFPLSRLCFEGPEEDLALTKNAQPALLVTSIAALAAAREVAAEKMAEPDFMAGHSLGEYTALAVAGALDFETAVALSRERGQLMYSVGLKKPGAMAAILGLCKETIEEICSETEVFIANINCPGQTVISGVKENLAKATALAKERGAKFAVKLNVSGAFHSPLMEHAAASLNQHITKANISVPNTPVIGNTMSQVLKTVENVRDELLNQICSCVRWEDTVRYMISQGVNRFVEIGPGDVLTGLIGRISSDVTSINIGSCEDIKAMV